MILEGVKLTPKRTRHEGKDDDWGEVKESEEVKVLKSISTSYSYLSLFMFSGAVTKLNYQPDVNTRATSVSAFFGNKKNDDSLYNSLIQRNGSAFNSRPLCVYTFAVNSENRGLKLKSCSQGPVVWQVGRDTIQMNNSRPTLRGYLFPNVAQEDNFSTTFWVMNIHETQFKGEIPPSTDSYAIRSLFGSGLSLKDTDELVQFIIHHELPPRLIVTTTDTSTGKKCLIRLYL
jgi:hypothetical protein